MRSAKLAFHAFAASLLLFASGNAVADSTGDGINGMQTLSLEAVVVEGAEPLRDVSYLVERVDRLGGQGLEAKSVDGLAVVSLPAGRYRVTATHGYASSQQEVAVGDRPAHHVINLRAGTVRMKAIANVGAKAIPANLDWEILTYGRDSTGKRRLIATSKEAQPSFTLAEGYYLAVVKRGGRVTKHTIEVNKGITYKYTVLLH